ncbi:putative F-box/FBD/LRR-repeat protein At5g56810 [Lycium barbarum]|uniref:putative F-box/FBD/LRR-repeat protein At5g56810 n=1 Tax=Lycium barbarum TaxID=112863 RepID=UPI00293E5A64|nr:putative F-box/FBD/LRR-repeat protein At5g56810 [Lycium barbarum]XP_060190793.1 putative F-box/FBD/LRR-repeat protein At5g56810 [Lycium barbarum]
MAQGRKRVAVKHDRNDRISDLPNNVLNRILELLPVHDAARTSILSKQWRSVWAMLPNMKLDNHFCNKLMIKCLGSFKGNSIHAQFVVVSKFCLNSVATLQLLSTLQYSNGT